MRVRLSWALGLLWCAALAAGGGLFWFFSDSSERQLRDLGSSRIAQTSQESGRQVEAYLATAERTVLRVAGQLEAGWTSSEPAQVAEEFQGAMAAEPNLRELTLTYPKGSAVGQVQALCGGTHTLRRPLQPDPADHPTYLTPASEDNLGQALWSDLHFLEGTDHQVGVTVQRAVRNSRGKLIGVLRAGLATDKLEKEVREAAPAGHLAFLCDSRGRLVTRFNRTERYEVTADDELRAPAPGTLAQALALVRRGQSLQRFEEGGKAMLGTLVRLPSGLEWSLGVVAPESEYVGALRQQRDRLLWLGAALGLSLAFLAGALLALLRRDLSRIQGQSQRMQAFHFEGSRDPMAFAEMAQLSRAFESAKTSLRGLCKYVPVGLVRQLHTMGREPVLGGELAEVSMLFSDIANFTTLAEKESPAEVGRWLGRYFEVMTQAVHRHEGVIDKYIGDSVMALWNVPVAQPDHVHLLCQAAWECAQQAIETGLPTRIGLHVAEVMVGHYGSPERMSYTVLGDGVNLASRLEGLNKEYGTSILASSAVAKRVQDRFQFRYLGAVAVKGKSLHVDVYEMLGPREPGDAKRHCPDIEESEG